MNEPQKYEDIRSEGDGESYPRHLLEGHRDALVLFAGGFYGRQDAFWIAEAGLQATCVDIRPKNLGVMSLIYPGGWEFVEADAFNYASTATRQWDVVSIDCPSGSFDLCAELMPLWCRLARHAIVLGSALGTKFGHYPEPWRMTEIRRRSDYAGGVYWACFERRKP